MIMRSYCEKCGSKAAFAVRSTRQHLIIRGEECVFYSKTRYCLSCKQPVFSAYYDQKTIMKAYETYRKHHHYLKPKQIHQLREDYGLSQGAFESLLGWPKGTLLRYEQGYLQSLEHDELLRELSDYRKMEIYLQKHRNLLKKADYLQLMQRIKAHGFVRIDIQKIAMIIAYLSQSCEGLFKTKLYKLLFYADMLAYKESGQSLTGLIYHHYAYGPYPKELDGLLERLIKDKYLHKRSVLKDNKRQQLLVCDQPYVKGRLESFQLSILDRVLCRFKDFSARKISLYSHAEQIYRLSVDGQQLDYDLAKELEL